jgi:hypothetical protein
VAQRPDVSGSASVDELFDEIASRLPAEHADVEEGRMLRASGLSTHGKFFVFATRGQLVVKLPAERVAELIADGAGAPFESGRRVMREWVSLRPDDAETCTAYVDEARTFVAGLAQA